MKPLKLLLCLFILVLCSGGRILHANPGSSKPFPPFRIAGNLYFVGNKDQADYLVVTSKGNILINTDYQANVALIKANIEKLGFTFKDTKILLISQAHKDHDEGSALIKAQTGAKYMVMDADIPAVESGGKADFQYGNDPQEHYQAVKVDRVLHDGDKVELGGTVLVAHLTPGHTKGCTTWTMKLTDDGNTYHVVIVGGPYVNPGYKLVNNAAYPTISKDYHHMWQVLKSLPCDIFLGAHGVYFGLEDKYARMQKGEINPFVDPQGYKKFIAQTEHLYNQEFAKQSS